MAEAFSRFVDGRNPRGEALKQFQGESNANQSMDSDELYIFAFGSVMIGQRVWSENVVNSWVGDVPSGDMRTNASFGDI